MYATQPKLMNFQFRCMWSKIYTPLSQDGMSEYSDYNQFKYATSILTRENMRYALRSSVLTLTFALVVSESLKSKSK